MNVDITVGLAKTLVDCFHAFDCVQRRYSYEIFDRIPDDPLEGTIGFGQSIGGFADIDDVGDHLSSQFIEQMIGGESPLPNVACDAVQLTDPSCKWTVLGRRATIIDFQNKSTSQLIPAARQIANRDSSFFLYVKFQTHPDACIWRNFEVFQKPLLPTDGFVLR